MSQVRVRFITIMCGALVLLGAFLMPMGTVASNSEAAKACEDGGYLDYTRADDTPFKNEGQCTRYAAQGGMLKAVPTASLSITYGTPQASQYGGYIVGMIINGSGLEPNSQWTITINTPGGSYVNGIGYVPSNGTLYSTWSANCTDVSVTVAGIAADGSPVSVTEPVPC